MVQVKLVFPEIKHKEIVQEFINECKNHNSEFAGISRLNELPYETWLKKISDSHLGIVDNPGYVPATTFLVMDEDKLVGFVDIRHQLNDFLINVGGHIGYMVRPLERSKGYAKALLKESLKYCKEQLQLTKVLVTCDHDNIGSKRTILANNGKYENTVQDENFGTVERYWIEL